MPQPVRPPRLHVRAPASHRGPAVLPWVLPPEIQPVRDLVKGAMQTELGNDRVVRVVVTLFHRGPAEDLGPHDAVVVIAAAIEQYAPEALRRPGRGRGQRVLVRVRHGSRQVDLRGPGVREHDLRILVERLDTQLEQVTGIKVVVRRPFEQLATRFVHDGVVVRSEPDILRLADVADPGVLFLVLVADIAGTVRRGIIRDDQLEIGVALAEQGIE